MRTTLTIDPDVERYVRAHMRKKRVPMKVAVNDLLRTGFVASRSPQRGRQKVVLRSVSLDLDPTLLHKSLNDAAFW